MCPSCSRLYRPTPGSSWRPGSGAARASIRRVVEHPQLFVTLTAPSFGAVHRSGERKGRPGAVPASAQRRAVPARPLALVHGAATTPVTPFVGEPLCAECFDYRGAVLWNAHVPALWDRTCAALYREVAGAAGLLEHRAAPGGPALLHQGGRVPAPGPRPPPRRAPSRRWRWAGRAPAALARRRRARPRPSAGAVARAEVPVPLTGIALARAGPLGRRDSTSVSSSRAERRRRRPSPPTSPSTPRRRRTARRGWPTGSARAAEIERLALRPHLVALVRTAWVLGRTPGPRRPAAARARPHPRLRRAVLLQERGATRPPSRPCAGPGPHYVEGRRGARPRLRRRVALRRPGLRLGRVRGAGRSVARRPPHDFPRTSHGFHAEFHRGFHSVMTSEFGAEEISPGTLCGSDRGTLRGTHCGAMAP